MSFTPGTLSLVVDSIAGGAFRVWFYHTTDAKEDILATGYGVDAEDRGLAVGDLIGVYDTVRDAHYEIAVQSIDANGTATFYANIDSPVVSVLDYGADRSNNSATSCKAAFEEAQDAAKDLYGKHATVYVPEGRYFTSEEIVWKPDISWDMDWNARITATAAMNAIIATGTTSDESISECMWNGGWLNGAGLALDGIHMRSFGRVWMNRSQIENCTRSFMHIADASGANAGGLRVQGGRWRINPATGGSASVPCQYGILTDLVGGDGFTDSEFHQVQIQNVGTGVAGYIYVCGLSQVHIWNYDTNYGALDAGFDIYGDGNHFTDNKVDGPATYFFRNRGRENQLFTLNSNMPDTGAPGAGAGTFIYNEPSVGATITVGNCNVRAPNNSDHIAAEFGGDLDGITYVGGNQRKNCHSILEYPKGKHLLFSDVRPDLGSIGSHTGDTNATVFYTYTVPAGVQGTFGQLEVDFEVSFSGNAAAKQLLAEHNNNTAIGEPTLAADRSSYIGNFKVINRGAANRQFLTDEGQAGGFGHSFAAAHAQTANTAVDQDITFEITLGDAADGVEMEWINVWLVKPKNEMSPGTFAT